MLWWQPADVVTPVIACLSGVVLILWTSVMCNGGQSMLWWQPLDCSDGSQLTVVMAANWLMVANWCCDGSPLTVVMAANWLAVKWCSDSNQLMLWWLSILFLKAAIWCCNGSQLAVVMAANWCWDGCQSLLLKKPFDWCYDGCLFLMPYIILKSFRVIFSGTDQKFIKNVLDESYLYIFMHWLLEMMGRLTSRSTGEIWPNSDSLPQPAIHKVLKVKIWYLTN